LVAKVALVVQGERRKEKSMEKVVLKATKRAVRGKQVGALRRSGKLPGVIYGHRTEPISITLDAHSAGLALSKIGSSSLITLDVDGKEYPALVRERQRDFIKGTLRHVDFQAVSLTERIRANVRIEVTGVSPAVKDLDAVLVMGLHALSVECLPTDLPDHIVVDISNLAQVGDGIHVRDVAIPDKVRVLDDPDVMIVVTTFAKVEAVEEAPAVVEGAVAVEAEGAEPELSVERGKKEEEAPEGEGKKTEAKKAEVKKPEVKKVDEKKK
jgi:large subunit ribosomal protein L25